VAPRRTRRTVCSAASSCAGAFIPGEARTHARATLEKRTGARLLTPAQVVAGKGFDGLFEFRKVGQTSAAAWSRSSTARSGIGTTSAPSCRSA
jgi:hypothetical protein